ncbi:hypothetical protein Golomagni_02389 [Golovinomyces magnicellulatus]|nr:hypothetical protein Golomagni_02389 [Golovinomyces magnicellulatus]
MPSVHESQKMRESDRAILAHNNRAIEPFAADINAYLNRVERGGWSDRMKKQLLSICTAAYIFMPPNHAAEIMSDYLQALEAYINETHGRSSYNQWLNYHKKEGLLYLTKAAGSTSMMKTPKFFGK